MRQVLRMSDPHGAGDALGQLSEKFDFWVSRPSVPIVRLLMCVVRLGEPSRTMWSIQYDQICRGLVLAGLLRTAPPVVLVKNKPVATDL